MSRGRGKGVVGQRQGETNFASPRGSEDLEGAGSVAAPGLERHLCLSPWPWPGGLLGSLRETERPKSCCQVEG